ncbi:MAG TPA: LysE family transporter [Gammaproteobacteria bacterium]|jgi:threonine/homoserine/homoserine lactone efflux protein|nr:LysE family transporter [Gammaproteobacteria bacterium]
MSINLFMRGAVIGFAIAAPVGPIGMLVIRRTLAEGRLLGLLTGLGAAVADALYGCVGAFGLTFISSFLMGYTFWTKLIGSAFLVYLGIKTFRAKPREESTGTSKVRYASAFLTTLALTLTNPATILSFMAVFAGLGLGTKPGDYGAAGVVVAGVFTGSAIWWLMLSGGVALVRHKLKPETMRWINHGSGASLVAFGLYAVVSLAV